MVSRPDVQLMLGSRGLQGSISIERSWLVKMAIRIFAAISSMLLGMRFYDTQCGFKLMKPALAGKVFSRPFRTRWIFDVELILRVIDLYGITESISLSWNIP